MKGNTMIVYASDSDLYVPHCIPISEIDIIEETDHCYHDVPIRIFYNGSTILAFLQHDGILKRHSQIVKCETIHSQFKLTRTQRVIIRKGKTNRVEFASNYPMSYEKINFLNANLHDLNFHHMQAVIESVDILDDIDRFMMVSEKEGNFVIDRDTILQQENI